MSIAEPTPTDRTARDRSRPRRRRAPVDPELIPLLGTFRARHPKGSSDLIERAYAVARDAHVHQVRRSGEPYISHPVAVATIIADLGLDEATIAAALLHDAVEDTTVSREDLEREFGAEVSSMVEGVTKLDRIKFDSREAQQAATLRKMLVAMAKDVRVLLIKLADRLHNMRTIASLPQAKQTRIAQETLDIYAPLAHRMGVGDVKWQLEDLSFAVLHPKRYAEIEQLVATQAPERGDELDLILRELRAQLAGLGIEAEVQGRPKHYWSIYEKMVVKGKEFDEVFDLVGVRVVVDSVKDCYGALGTIHAVWRPVTGRFKDYIAMPKFNLYQSLHTTVVGPKGKPVEVQIRTREMHRRAEYGIAAHWSYKDVPGRGNADDLAWLQRIVDFQQEAEDPAEFMQTLKVDLDEDEVFVFTPKGKVVTLPTGSTPIDFAYAIHTEVGHRCIGARVNGRLVAVDSTLASGDTVEIFTSKVEGAGPSRDWLQFAHSPRARSKIKQWFSRERRSDAIDNGRDALVAELRREGLPVQRLADSDALLSVATSMRLDDVEDLYAAIGEGRTSAQAVAHQIHRELREEEQLPVTARRPQRTAQRRRSAGVHVEGLDDVMVRLSRCCTPVPGDEIMGFVTRGRGVSVHRTDCANASGLATVAERVIEVEWDLDAAGTFVVSLEVEALDRAGLLRDIAQVLSEHHVSIVASSSQTTADRVARLRFDFELADPGHLDQIIGAVKRVRSVYEAQRLLPGRTSD